MFTKNRTVLVRSLFLLSRFNNGALKDKKTETKSIGNDFVTIDTDVVVKIPKSLNNGVKIKYDGLNLKMKPLGLMSKNKTFATPEGNSYRYTDTYDVFTDIVYTPTFTGVKCDIVLEEYTGRNTFRFEIHTNGYCLEKDENEKAIYVKDDDGNRILCFNPVVSYDSAGNVGNVSVRCQDNAKQFINTVQTAGHERQLSLYEDGGTHGGAVRKREGAAGKNPQSFFFPGDAGRRRRDGVPGRAGGLGASVRNRRGGLQSSLGARCKKGRDGRAKRAFPGSDPAGFWKMGTVARRTEAFLTYAS